jgi:hypothetical protein
MGWDDFLKFLELFFNREMWHGMGWYRMIIEFSKIFFNRESDVTWVDFLKFLQLFFNRERRCGMLLEFLDLFFNGEMWHNMRWFFLIFLKLFLM